MNFIKANDKLINLDHVSSITLLNNRVAFDLDCPVELDNGKIISYYAYHDYTDARELDKILTNQLVQREFIRHNNILINKNHISAIKFINDRYRVIVNLSHSTTSSNYNKDLRLTSKFIYLDCEVSTEFDELVEKINTYLGV